MCIRDSNRVQTLNSFVHLGNNIGIGTETPRQLFDVEGQVRADKLNVINEVGVGTESPLQTLQVNSTNTFSVRVSTAGTIGIGSNRITGIDTTGIFVDQYVIGPAGVFTSDAIVTEVGISSIGILSLIHISEPTRPY